MTSESKKNPPINISVTFKESTVNQIRKIALSNCKSIHNTVIYLANTAIKYNYTEDYRYIPCKPQRDNTVRIGKERTYIINLLISSSLNERLSALMKANFTENRSATFRSLVETALIYDYDENLFFHHPQKLSISNLHNNKSNDIIMLDII
ncbi:MAG: hypothetical protein ACI4I6_07905 [Hominimerdicola sp.]